jgi:hypothetical protein
LRSQDLNELVSFRKISTRRLELATESWSPGSKAMLQDFVAFLHPPEQLIRLLRANNIPIESVLRPSEVHARVQGMIDNLYW